MRWRAALAWWRRFDLRMLLLIVSCDSGNDSAKHYGNAARQDAKPHGSGVVLGDVIIGAVYNLLIPVAAVDVYAAFIVFHVDVIRESFHYFDFFLLGVMS